MEKQTFVNQMTARGYEPTYVSNGNTVRLVPLANYVAYIDTPSVTAIIREGVSRDTPDIIDGCIAVRLSKDAHQHC